MRLEKAPRSKHSLRGTDSRRGPNAKSANSNLSNRAYSRRALDNVEDASPAPLALDTRLEDMSFVMTNQGNIIDQLESALASDDLLQRADTLERVTNLFVLEFEQPR